jgi:hypothetical protein
MALPVTQQHSAGCAVACVAYALGFSYAKALKLFDKPDNALRRGFYCSDIVKAFAKVGKSYSYCAAKAGQKKLLTTPFTIVFIARSRKYPIGHYLVRTKKGFWMNPWSNFPCIAPAKSECQKKLPGKVTYIIFPVL